MAKAKANKAGRPSKRPTPGRSIRIRPREPSAVSVVAGTVPLPARRGGRHPRGGLDRYHELVRRHPLLPIRTEAELDRALAVIDSLLDRDDLDRGEEDYLDVLSDLVEKYEAEEHPLEPVPDGEMLRHLLDARGITQARLARDLGIPESTVSEVLKGRRGLSRRVIGMVAEYFHVSPAVFRFGG